MSQTDLRRLSKRFSAEASAGSSGELTETIQAPSTIDKCDVRFYPGPRLDLELLPFVRRGETGKTVPLPDLTGRDVVVGDDDDTTFYVAEPVSKGDTIGVQYENTNTSNAYNFQVDLLLDRAGGQRRIFGGDS